MQLAPVSVSVDIPRPVSEVWDEVAHLDRHANWMSDVEHIEFVGSRRAGVGTVMRVRTRVGPFVVNDDITVEDWIEGHHIVVTHGGRVSGIGVFELASIPGGTRFRWNERLRFPWYFGGPLATLVARPVLRRIWRRNLRRLAGVVT